MLLAFPTLVLATSTMNDAWEWTGILGTGQSLSVGANGHPVKSTEPRFANLKLSAAGLDWPVESSNQGLKLVPLVEPIGERAPTYPSSWPKNIDGESFHTSLGDQLSMLSRERRRKALVTVHAAIGESGQGMIHLKKGAVENGVNGRSFRAAIIATEAMTRLAKAEGKSFGIGAVYLTHGETDCGNANYEAEAAQLFEDYNAMIRTITGQTKPAVMIASQQNSLNDYSPSTQAIWALGTAKKTGFVCSGPKYQYAYDPDAVHLSTDGYQALGEKYAQVYYRTVIEGKKWLPLMPTEVEAKGVLVKVKFHVPVGPLVWETKFSAPHTDVPEWSNGKGFEIVDKEGKKVMIQKVEIKGDTVRIHTASPVLPGSRVSYAMVGHESAMQAPHAGTKRWGLLRDSDPFVGGITKVAQPNYAVAFVKTVEGL